MSKELIHVPSVEHHWFKIVLKDENIALDLISFLREMAVNYYFGSSLNVKLTPEIKRKIEELFPDKISLMQDKKIRSNDWVNDDNVWNLEDCMYIEALIVKEADTVSNDVFYNKFNSLFKIEGKGPLRIMKSQYKEITLFSIHFVEKIKTLCGLQYWVPRFSPDDKEKNKDEIFRLLVAVYPAYHNLCINNQWENKFNWSYNLEIDD